MIKAVIVEDSGLMRLRIRDVLGADKTIKVIATATNGRDGLSAIKTQNPDVVITDMVMPNYDGLYLVKEAMRTCPVPIVVLSGLERTNQQIFEALELGAFAFLDKPRSTRGLGFNKPLIDLVRTAAGVNTKTLLKSEKKRNNLDHTFSKMLMYDAVVIGASTGGPGAIESILKGLPSTFPVPIVIAQHMPPRFLESFAQRLNNCSNLTVKLAKKGEVLQSNSVYLCPGDANTVIVRNGKSDETIFATTRRKFQEFNEPSVDCLFDSAAETFGKRTVAIVLTGMGRDGASGLKNIKNKGGLTIAQDEESSVVFGMPKAAIGEKSVDYTLNICQMAGFVTSCFS